MCFSAQASFAGAIVLTSVGIPTLLKARHTVKLIPFAAIPILFALQQALEGIVWVTLVNGSRASVWHQWAVYGFIYFAGMVWPIWIPTSLYVAEYDNVRKKMLAALIVVGVGLALCSLNAIAHTKQTAEVMNNHIVYTLLDDPLGSLSQAIGLVVYLLGTVGSFFVSSLNNIWVLGVVLGIAWIISIVGYYLAFGSIWCFFVAMSSVMIYYIVVEQVCDQ